MPKIRLALSILLSIYLVILGCSEKQQRKPKVIDGDTFVMPSGEKVRLLGIDTPEKGEPYAERATNLLEKLIDDGKIKLKYDKQKYDKYGRLLAYVYVDTILVNRVLLDSGLAVAYFFHRNSAHFNDFVKAQKSARLKSINIWSKPPKDTCEYYLATKSSFRFHRPTCRSVKGKDINTLRKFKTRDEALDEGLSPCRNCRP